MSWKQAFKTMWNCGIIFQDHDKAMIESSNLFYIRSDCYYPMGWTFPSGVCKVNHPEYLPEYLYWDNNKISEKEFKYRQQFIIDNYSYCRIVVCKKCGLIVDTLTPAKENAIDIGIAFEQYKEKELEFKKKIKEKISK